MPTIKPTHSAIKAARSPKGKRTFYSIDGHPGLYLRVGARSRSWMLRSEAEGRTRWTVIGDHPAMPFQDAVAAVAELRSATAATANPIEHVRAQRAAARRKAALQAVEYTLAEFGATVVGVPLSERRRKLGAKRSAAEERRLFDKYIVPDLGEVKLHEIETRHVARLRKAIKAPSEARKSIAALRAILSHALTDGLVTSNAARGVKTEPAGERDRVLTDDELRAFWLGTGKTIAGVRPAMRDALRLQLLLALRAKEAASLRWVDFDAAACTLTIPAEVSKNGQAHTLPLSTQAVELLRRQDRDGELIFPAHRAKGPVATDAYGVVLRKVRTELGLAEAFTTHDMRRTAATRLAGLGVQPHVIERILNHRTGILGGVAGVYNRETYREQMALALQGWADELDRLATGDAGDGKVVQISRGRG